MVLSSLSHFLDITKFTVHNTLSMRGMSKACECETLETAQIFYTFYILLYVWCIAWANGQLYSRHIDSL